ncbi:glycoside hydrolase family 53 protein [Boletus coccyginus]|nr:glycoside hydrolase family 53 protein [Boletus coccyginus]
MCCFVIFLIVLALSLVSALPYHGADFSSLLLLESTTDTQYAPWPTAPFQPFEQILYDYGVDLARIRVWTSGTYDLTYSLELAKRAKAVGMDLLIDLHYDDTWADPGHQAIPSSWPTDLDGLVSQVYNYTYELVQAFNAQGTPVQFIQIGNEINDGLLWPTGQISVNGFTGVSRLLHAGALAVRTASPSTKNVIHLANGWDQASISWFYTGIFNKSETGEGLECGLTHSDVDVMGFSFYPFYGTSATLSNLRSSMDYVVSTYDKARGIQITGWMTRSYKHLQDIMIVETDWPAVCNTRATPLSEPTIPVNSEGQIIWVEDISAVLNNMNIDCGDKALGIVYWEPGWIGNAALGSPCADSLLVTSDGVARQSMTLFSDIPFE